jgi:hypothetical protein
MDQSWAKMLLLSHPEVNRERGVGLRSFRGGTSTALKLKLRVPDTMYMHGSSTRGSKAKFNSVRTADAGDSETLNLIDAE